MTKLTSIHEALSEWKEAAALEDVLLEKRRYLLGDNHPDTLNMMGTAIWNTFTRQRSSKAKSLSGTNIYSVKIIQRHCVFLAM
jgi:hypothetical protein